MNRREAAQVLAVIAAPYPGDPLDELMIEAWFHAALERVEFGEGLEIARQLIGHERFRPTPAVFNEALRIRRQQAAIAGAGVPALEAASIPSTHPQAEVIDELRAMLAKRGPRDHYHKGPNPCPVCGGMQTQKRDPGPVPLRERGIVRRGLHKTMDTK